MSSLLKVMTIHAYKKNPVVVAPYKNVTVHRGQTMSGHTCLKGFCNDSSVFVMQGFEAVKFLQRRFTYGKGGTPIPVGNNLPRWQGLQGQTSQMLDIHSNWAKRYTLFITLSSCNLSKSLKREIRRIRIGSTDLNTRPGWANPDISGQSSYILNAFPS